MSFERTQSACIHFFSHNFNLFEFEDKQNPKSRLIFLLFKHKKSIKMYELFLLWTTLDFITQLDYLPRYQCTRIGYLMSKFLNFWYFHCMERSNWLMINFLNCFNFFALNINWFALLNTTFNLTYYSMNYQINYAIQENI